MLFLKVKFNCANGTATTATIIGKKWEEGKIETIDGIIGTDKTPFYIWHFCKEAID